MTNMVEINSANKDEIYMSINQVSNTFYIFEKVKRKKF